MRILVAIPHYFHPTSGKAGDGREHGSVARDPQPRVEALSSCLNGLHQLYGRSQGVLEHEQKIARRITPHHGNDLDIVICTTGDCHLLNALPAPLPLFQHRPTQIDPLFLGFECHAVLRDRLGSYDFYCYLEDDIVLIDPWLFHKLRWFTGSLGNNKLLQPNRYEAGPHPLLHKVYLDGDLAERVTALWQNVQDQGTLAADVLGVRVLFQRPLNPHTGCFFLNAEQMGHWARQPYFLDRDTRFIGPLESAATLGILRAFTVYKPALENADFLEVRHFGTAYLRMICGESNSASESSI
jgi:hypothetical protein